MTLPRHFTPPDNRNMPPRIHTSAHECLAPVVPAPPPSTRRTNDEERSRIHCKLGRCVLRLQQYEMLCKSVMLAAEIEGSPSTIEANYQTRKERFAKMTLGTLVKEMKTSWLVSDDVQDEEERDFDVPPGSEMIWFRSRFRHSMDPATYERTIADMEELVAMRNDLIHHFLEHFNLWEIETCAEADRHLERSYETIDSHMNELMTWAAHMDEARQHSARIMASEEFQRMLVCELTATTDTATTCMDYAAVTALLKEAEAAHARNGWTLLEHAIEFVNKASNRAAYPSRYQCRTWHLLKRSGAFDVDRIALPEYRAR